MGRLTGKRTLTSVLYENRYSIAAFFLAAVIVTVTYAVRGIRPFGDNTVLRVDLFHQYAPFIEEMRSRAVNGQSLLYSWEGGLGKDHLAQMAYYTTSPLNLLAFLFPRQALPELAALLILLKISLSAGTFSWYLRRHFGVNDLSVMLFGLLYAFSAYLTCYYWNIMWLDTLVLFPLVALGAEQLMGQERRGLYYASLTLTMIVNFYLAVLVCILITLYWLVRLFSVWTWKEDRDKMVRRTVDFMVLSVLAAMTALFILAPVASALRETEASDMSFPDWKIYTNILQFIPDHFLGARAAVLARNEDLPNIYCGVLTMVLLPAWYADRAVPRRRKILYSLFLGFMLLACCIQPLDYLIHGLHFPANLPHRFAFVYSFILLVLAYAGLTAVRRGRVSLRIPAIACLVYAAGILLSEFVLLRLSDEIDRVLSDTDLFLNALLMAVYLVLLYVGQKDLMKAEEQPGRSLSARISLPLLLLLPVLFECQFSSITNLDDTGERDPYTAYMDSTDAAMQAMDEAEDGGFYRAEFRRFTSINDASLYHYNGFSQFSSLQPGGISALMEHLGLAATGNSFRYYDPSPLIDALFDVRYVLNRDVAHPKAERYDFFGEFGNVLVYRNDRVLPLGFVTDPAVLDWEYEQSDPFSVQNDLLHRAAGLQEDMFTLLPEEEFYTENLNITQMRSPHDLDYELMFPKSLEDIPSVHARYVSDRDQYVYLYVNAPNAGRFLYANASVREDRELSAGRSLIDVGWMTEGEPLEVEFALTDRGQFEKTYRRTGSVLLLCASYDDDVFAEAFETLSEEPLELTSFTDTRVEGTVDGAGGVLMTSIPLNSGWEASVDGEPAEILPVGGGLIGISVPAGPHDIVFNYRNRILLPAAILSVLGLVLAVLYMRRASRGKKEAAGHDRRV